MVGKIPVINQLTFTFKLVLFSDILITFLPDARSILAYLDALTIRSF